MKRGSTAVALILLLAAGCASGLGNRDPITRTALAWRVQPGTTAEQAGDFVKQGAYTFALIAAAQDSAWFATAAQRAGLETTRPGSVGDMRYAFLGPKAVGDTTHTVQVQGGGRLLLHDALFRMENRLIDLMLVRFDSVADLRSGVRALLGYRGSDVGNTSVVLLAIETPSQAFGDSIASRLRGVFYGDTRECANGQDGASGIRLFYGPEARVRCESAQIRTENGIAISARFVMP